MAASFLQIMAQRTLSDVKTQLVALCQANGLPVTSWQLGRPSERWVDITPRLIYAVLAGITTQAVRGFFLDLATDPGDPGDLSADQAPRAGFLSALGEGWYGVTRRGQTFATTTATVRNDGTTPATFSPFDLTFTTIAPEPAKSDGGRPTYRNEEDDSVYTGVGGTLTLAPGASATLPVIAEQIGSYGSASASSLTCVTQSFGTLTVTASALAIGEDREEATLYRARCRLAASKLAPGGPQAAYLYAMNTAKDGTPLQRHDGSGAVGITKGYVSPDSSTGVVAAYFADDDGAADTVDVDSANANITGVALGSITDTLGVLPDGVTYSGAAATNTNITIVGTAKIKSVPGTDDTALKTAAETAINTVAMPAYFAASPIGGEDQTAGAGVIPTADFVGVAYSAYAGIHAVAVTTPATSTTAIALGHVAHLVSCAITVTVVS